MRTGIDWSEDGGWMDGGEYRGCMGVRTAVGWERGQGMNGWERGQGMDENKNRGVDGSEDNGWIGAKTGG